MKMFHKTTYKLYRNNPTNLKFGIISDLHFSYKISDKKLSNILDYLKKEKLDYILFPGDIIDYTNLVQEPSERQRLLNWLQQLGNINKALLSLGSHDYYKKNSTGHWEYYLDQNLLDSINSLNNVELLDNSKYEDQNINVVGITQSYPYYHPSDTKKEKGSEMLTDLKKMRNLLTKLPKDKLNFALIHSPVCLTDKDIAQELSEFDYLISGHMHNGCVPPIMYELWNSTRGLIAPNKQLFPSNERNTLKYNNDKILVNGPLTTFQECTGIIEKFNILFPSYMSFMEFSNDSKYNSNKIHIERKYEKMPK